MENKRKALLFVGTTFGAWWLLSRLSRNYALSELINPSAVADIAATFPEDREGFISAAERFVVENIRYEDVESDIDFVKRSIQCVNCYVPAATLNRGTGNCVGMSSLVASLLRNRLPPEDVYMVVGQLNVDGVGGHAWVEVHGERGTEIIEATVPKLPETYGTIVYKPMAVFNDRYFECYDDELCGITTGSCFYLKNLIR